MYYSKQIFICLWHIFWIDSIFALIHFWPTLLGPKSNIWFSNVAPTQSCSQFLWCSHMGTTLRNATALPDFLVPTLCCKVRITQYIKTPMTMVITGSPNFVQNNSLNILTPSILTMHHTLPLSWQGAPTLRSPSNHFLKYTHFHPTFLEFMNLQILTHWEEKQGHFSPFQLQSLTPLIITECKRHGAYFGVKINVSSLYFTNFHTKLSQNTNNFCIIFPNVAQNMQQSTKKEGQLLTAKIGWQRK